VHSDTSYRSNRWYRVPAVLAATVVMGMLAHSLGPTTRTGCTATNPFDRLGLWLAEGSHVDGPAGAPSCVVPHPLTWVAVCLIAATGLGLAILTLRRH
jgi:hypothetical protein